VTHRPIERSRLPAKEKAAARFGGRSFVSFAAVFAIATAFAILLILVRSKWAGLLNIDNGVAEDLHDFVHSRPGFASALRAVSFVGSSVVWWSVLALVAGWLAYRRLPRLVAYVAVTAIGSSLLNNAIKVVVARTRPHLADPVATAAGMSFPSGHAQAAIVGYGILLLVFLPTVTRAARLWISSFAALTVLAIGFSRIALGVHFLSDVIGGFLVGGAWLIAMTTAFSAWRTEEGKPPVHPGEGLEPEQEQRIGPGSTGSAPPEDHPTASHVGSGQDSNRKTAD